MGRHNNPARSLVIMSKLQGWDPTKIDGQEYVNNEYREDRVTKGDGFMGKAPMPTSPEQECPYPAQPGPDTRGPNPVGGKGGHHDPYAGK